MLQSLMVPFDCQQQSVPTNMKYLVLMLLNGCTIKDQDSQSCLTISQTIVFNCKRKSKASHYHSRNLSHLCLCI